MGIATRIVRFINADLYTYFGAVVEKGSIAGRAHTLIGRGEDKRRREARKLRKHRQARASQPMARAKPC